MGMGIKKLLNRVSIKNDNPKIMEVIADWLKLKGYEKQEFLAILRLADIKTPVRLQGLAMYRDEFKCIDKNNRNYRIEFFKEGNLVKIRISTNQDVREYILNQKSKSSDKMNLVYRQRTIKKDNKVLKSENSVSCSRKVLEYNGKKIIVIKCEKIDAGVEESYKIDFRAWEAIEKYLVELNCDKEINAEEIQKKLNEKFLGQYICKIEVQTC